MVDSDNTESYLSRAPMERDTTQIQNSHLNLNGKKKKIPHRLTHIDMIFEYCIDNRSLGLDQVCQNLSLTKHIGRLIYYTIDKKDKNDLKL